MFDYSFLNDKAKEIFEEGLLFDNEIALSGAQLAESPIEQIMWILIGRLSRDLNFYPEAQMEFEINGKKYKADIAITRPGLYEDVVCIIECDGHDYHEKTKEQAQRDRSRDRAFQSQGIPVFRFTGSEIYNKPYECLKEIRSYLRKVINH